MEKIIFSPEGEEPVEFYCLEQTVIGAKTYLLVTDEEGGGLMLYISSTRYPA